MHLNFSMLIILFPLFHNFVESWVYVQGVFHMFLSSGYMSGGICPGGYIIIYI